MLQIRSLASMRLPFITNKKGEYNRWGSEYNRGDTVNMRWDSECNEVIQWIWGETVNVTEVVQWILGETVNVTKVIQWIWGEMGNVTWATNVEERDDLSPDVSLDVCSLYSLASPRSTWPHLWVIWTSWRSSCRRELHPVLPMWWVCRTKASVLTLTHFGSEIDVSPSLNTSP